MDAEMWIRDCHYSSQLLYFSFIPSKSRLVSYNSKVIVINYLGKQIMTHSIAAISQC